MVNKREARLARRAATAVEYVNAGSDPDRFTAVRDGLGADQRNVLLLAEAPGGEAGSWPLDPSEAAELAGAAVGRVVAIRAEALSAWRAAAAYLYLEPGGMRLVLWDRPHSRTAAHPSYSPTTMARTDGPRGPGWQAPVEDPRQWLRRTCTEHTRTIRTPAGVLAVNMDPATVKDQALLTLYLRTEQQHAELRKLNKKITRLTKEVARLQTARALNATTTPSSDGQDGDPRTRLQEEIVMHWIGRRASEPHLSLAPPGLPDAFLQTVPNGNGGPANRVDVIDAIVDVCTGAASDPTQRAPRRQPHDATPNGTDRRIRTRDQARAMRCYIRNATPAAPRLSYWLLPTGEIELSHVGVHDDYRMRNAT